MYCHNFKNITSKGRSWRKAATTWPVCWTSPIYLWFFLGIVYANSFCASCVYLQLNVNVTVLVVGLVQNWLQILLTHLTFWYFEAHSCLFLPVLRRAYPATAQRCYCGKLRRLHDDFLGFTYDIWHELILHRWAWSRLDTRLHDPFYSAATSTNHHESGRNGDCLQAHS